MEELIISADSHVIEVPDLWEKGMPQALRERAPKVYFDEKKDAWMFGAPEVTPGQLPVAFHSCAKGHLIEKGATELVSDTRCRHNRGGQ